jgi:hypothetical protein
MKRNRLLLIGLTLLTALVLIVWGHNPWFTSQQWGIVVQSLPAQAQSPTPARKASPSPTTPARKTPAVKPTAQVTPSPKAIPVSPVPAAKPSVPPLPLSQKPYKDPAERFQVGVLEGYKVSALGGAPLIESPDGNLAYTVAVRSRATTTPLSNAFLAQIAIETFEQGEGFQAGDFQQAFSEGVRIPWTGSLTTNRQTQPMSGVILARQQEKNVVMLLIAATKSAAAQVESAIVTLGESLKLL